MELVKQNKEIEREMEELQDMERKYTVLNQRQLRIRTATEQKEQEIKEIEGNIKALQNDMQKLNALVERNSAIQNRLAEGNFDLENDFHNQLKQSGQEVIFPPFF